MTTSCYYKTKLDQKRVTRYYSTPSHVCSVVNCCSW